MQTLNDCYNDICKNISTISFTDKNFLYLTNYCYFKINPKFNYDLDKYLYINKEKKLKYIAKNYYDELKNLLVKKNNLTKINFISNNKKHCIIYYSYNRIFNSLTVVFRASRIFPTLYLDFIILKSLCKKYDINTIDLFFNYLWIGQDIVLFDLFNPFKEKSKIYNKILNKWNITIDIPTTFQSRTKIKNQLNLLKNNSKIKQIDINGEIVKNERKK